MIYRLLNLKNFTADKYAYAYSMLSSEKKTRIEKFKFPEDKMRSAAGDMLARQMISEQCGLPPEKIIFRTNEYGKPFAEKADAHFSISHSEDYVLCAVNSTPIGADIEKIRDIPNSLIQKICTENEQRYIFETADCISENFFKIWVSKEAYFKFTGTGIKDLKSIDTIALGIADTAKRIDDYVFNIYSGQ